MTTPGLDGKFDIEATRRRDGESISRDQCVLFLAKDNAFPATLQFYRKECERIGCDREQLEAVDRLIVRVDMWRAWNASKLKLPDAEPGECL